MSEGKLPISTSAAATEAPAAIVLPMGKGTVLFVDDEPMVVEMGSRMLERLGYEVVSASRGAEALECFRKAPERYSVLITDQTMPKMTGAQLSQAVLAIRKDIPIVLCTGFSATMSESMARTIGVREVVMKPFSMKTLADAISTAIGNKV